MSRKFMRIKLSGTSAVNLFKGVDLMIYVGIDIAKQTHFAACSDSDGTILLEPFPFSNDIAGFKSLISAIESLPKDSLIIGMESTAHYAENLLLFLYSKGFNVVLINPIQTSSLRKSNIRKTKTDRIDTFLIIKAILMNQYRIFSKSDYDSLQLKSLCRFRQKLVKSKTKVKIQLVSYIDLIFPELQYFFKSGIHTKSCYALLKEESRPDKIAQMNLTRLSNLLKKTSKSHYTKEHAIALKKVAAQSVGISDDTLSLQILQSINQIELFEKQLQEVDSKINEIMDKMNSVIKTIPGIGNLNGAMIIGEIGDIKRFEKPCQLLAYAGLDPAVYQSGKFTASKTKMSKRGSKMLRYALINAAWQLTLNNETFKKYYDLKVSQGRKHYAALGPVAHKLVRVIHKMMTDDIEFNLN